MDAVDQYRQTLHGLVEEFGLEFRPATFDAAQFLGDARADELRRRHQSAYLHGIEQYFLETYRIDPNRWRENVVRLFAKGVEPDRWNWLVGLLASEWRKRTAKETPFVVRQLIRREDFVETDRLAHIRLRELCREQEARQPVPQPASAPGDYAPAVSWPKDQHYELREALRRALQYRSAEELSQQSAGVVNPVGVDSETIRRIAKGETRNPRGYTVRQLRRTLINLGYLSAESGGAVGMQSAK